MIHCRMALVRELWRRSLQPQRRCWKRKPPPKPPALPLVLQLLDVLDAWDAPGSSPPGGAWRRRCQ